METIINAAFEDESLLKNSATIDVVEMVMSNLDSGKFRVCEHTGEGWITHQWLKKAILLYFKIKKMVVVRSGDLSFVDKIPVKQWIGTEGVRVVPNAVVRYGAHVCERVVLMPSYVNIGAYVDEGAMVDTWVTVGSCAQIGKRVHLSEGVGIGGVLEPLQNNPVIVEDDVFIGSRCTVVEGVHIGSGAVLAAGVVVTGSTRIVDVTGAEMKIMRGSIPENAVVIPGAMPKKFPAGEMNISCALVIGERNEKTDRKTSLNDVLRDYNIAV